LVEVKGWKRGFSVKRLPTVQHLFLADKSKKNSSHHQRRHLEKVKIWAQKSHCSPLSLPILISISKESFLASKELLDENMNNFPIHLLMK
jgi:hypothetical protein